jgi:autotransporter-associated beta strand protein
LSIFAGLSSSSLVDVAAGAIVDISDAGPFPVIINALSGGGVVQLGAANLTIADASTEFSGTIEGIGRVEVSGTTQTFSGTNSYSGPTEINFGTTLALKGAGSLGNSIVGFAPCTCGLAAILDVSQSSGGAHVAGLNDSSGFGRVELGSQTLTLTANNPYPFPGVIAFLGVIADGGIAGGSGGGITLAPGAYQILGGVNTYTGATTIGAGATLEIDFPDGSIVASSGVKLTGAGATFDISNSGVTTNQTIRDLSGVAGSVVALGRNQLTLGTPNLSTFAGTIEDGGVAGGTGGALVKQGSGALTLTGANTYTGGTTLSGGTITVGNNSALGSGALAMAAGTTLSFVNDGNFTLGNNIRLSGDPNFAPPAGTTQTLPGLISDGTSPGTLSMLGPGMLVLAATNTYTGARRFLAGRCRSPRRRVGAARSSAPSTLG